jgi:diaminohydroxyphosphoribosylaminopyrimidine deaminase/5-amino-6-(5-phosphoribosylamino)uracil reductase
MKTSTTDEQFMKRALQLAATGEGKVGFRPLVGCVLVKNGKIISEAKPNPQGLPHVEALALKKAGKKAEGATAYVNLEPCAWHKDKKAPACCEGLAKAKVGRVVCAMLDPHTKINGKGIGFLRRAGIRVTQGVCEKEARGLNEPWIKYCSTGLPLVVLKMAVSLDGKIWSPKIKAISNEKEMEFVQKLRNKYQAILVGAGTIVKDNPRLTCRMKGGRDPLRVIIDSKIRSSTGARVFKDSNAAVFTVDGADPAKARELEAMGIRVYSTGREKHVNLRKVLEKLAELKVTSVMVEGGSEVATAFINEKLVDRVVFAVAPKLLGEGVPAVQPSLSFPVILQGVSISVLDDNAVFSGRPNYRSLAH